VALIHHLNNHFLAVPNLARTCSTGPCPVSQSTYYTVSPHCNPAHANDNDFNRHSFLCTCMGGGFCNDNDPWVRIDLQRTQNISSGVVTSRGGSPSRIDNFKIWVGNVGDIYNAAENSLCYTANTFQHWISPFKHEFPCVAYGRYVFFQPTVILSNLGDSNPNADFIELQIYNVSVFEGWLSACHCGITCVQAYAVII
jgi:hypothetical protein